MRKLMRTYCPFERFVQELSTADAGLILSDLSVGGMRALIRSNHDVGLRWLGMLNSASDTQLRHLHSFAVQVSIVLAAEGVAEAEGLLDRAMGLDPTIQRVQGSAKISSDTIEIWKCAEPHRLKR